MEPQAKGGHHIELLECGDAYFPALIRALDASVLEVRLETYIFHFDACGEQVAHALVRAAHRGVAVYVVVDGVGTPHTPQHWLRRFAAAGVQWRTYSPLGRFGVFIPVRWRRLHRKLCVVDMHKAFCGGINIQDDWVDLNHGAQEIARFDFAVQMTGPLVADIHQTLTQLWGRMQAKRQLQHLQWRAASETLEETFKPVGRDVLTATRAESAVDVPPGRAVTQRIGRKTPAIASLVLRDNVHHRTRIERTYRKAIASARHEVLIANAYFLPGHKLRRALIHAARRGVRVRLLLQGRYEYFMQFHAARPVYGALLAAGVEIYEYAHGFLHAKVAVIDDVWATVGSSNLEPLSLLLAREANIVVHDGAFAQTLRARLEIAMTQHAVLLDGQTYKNSPLRQRCLDLMAYGLMRLSLFLMGRRY